LPWCGGTAAAILAIGLYWSLAVAPPDYQQGDTVRIMYIHVPAAWMALSVYLFVAAASAVALVWRHPLAEVAARAAAPIGAAFTFICLATGSLWGRPMWGTWWVWDARLTSVLENAGANNGTEGRHNISPLAAVRRTLASLVGNPQCR